MDEMNIVAGTSARSTNAVAANDQPLGLVSNKPMDFSVTRPPIFFPQ